MTISSTTTITPNVLTTIGFDKIGQGVSYYSSDNNVSLENAISDPTLIIICSWAFAQPKHIAKYLQPYQEFYPNADILLIQNIIANAIWRPDAWQLGFFQPAASKVKEHLAFRRDARILVHAFSNGGSHAAVQLSETCQKLYGLRLPVEALLLDSCPGQPRFFPTIDALVQGIPSKNPVVRGVTTVLSYLSIGATGLCDILEISELAAWKLYRKLNDPTDSFLMKTVDGTHQMIPRTYIFSKSDTMIMYDDIVGHARVAKDKLFADGFEHEGIKHNIELQEFIGTAHVNHLKNDSERYWRIVQDTWDRTRSR